MTSRRSQPAHSRAMWARFGDEPWVDFERQGVQHKRLESDVGVRNGGQGVSDWPKVFALETVHQRVPGFVRRARLRIRSAPVAHDVQVP